MTTTAIKERPILFSAPMVKAILEGRKTQTRRVVSPGNSDFGSAPREYWDHACFDAPHPGVLVDGYRGDGYLHVPCHCQTENHYLVPNRVDDCERCEERGWTDTRHRLYPRYATGDRLWVRETWRETGSGQRADFKIPKIKVPVLYAADDPLEGPWRPSIFMPRWASRITLEITEVRVERLQDISEADAMAEGMPQNAAIDCRPGYRNRELFQELWDRINGKKHPFASNPWVWAIEFKIVEESK